MSSRTTAWNVTDERAEGSPQPYEAHDSESMVKTHTMPPVRLEKTALPAAETGLLPSVHLAEGKDNSDVQDASRTAAESQPAARNGGNVKTPVILLVEDTDELAEVIQATLERLHMTIAHETHGAKAIDRFEALRPDVMLLDIGLPDMNGWQLLDTIKKKIEQGGGKMPSVVVMTAYGDPANRLVGKFQNVNEYLIKPFTPTEVERVVNKALGRP